MIGGKQTMKIQKIARGTIGILMMGALVSGLLVLLVGTAFGCDPPPPPPPPPDTNDSPGPRGCGGGQHKGKKAGGDDGCGSPVGSVNTFTGDLSIDDIPVWYDSVGEAMPFVISYSAQGGGGAGMGEHWTHNFNAKIISDGPYGEYVEYGNGWKYYFASDGEGGYISPAGIFDTMQAMGWGIQVTLRSKKRCCGRRGGGGGARSTSQSLPRDFSDMYFDSVGLLAEIEDPNGLTWTLTYDEADRLTTIADPLDRETTLTYTSGLLTQVTVPGGLYATFQYDTHDPKRLWKITDAAGDTYTFGYSGTRVTSITGPSGKQVWYTYGTFNNKTVVTATGITDVSESTQTYTYTEKTTIGQLWVDVTEEKDSLDRVTRYIYEFDDDDTDGAYYGTLLEVTTDQGGLNLRHTLGYDSERRVVSERDSYTAESGGKDHVDRYYYGDGNNPNQVTKLIDAENWTGSTSTSPAYLYSYDSLGNVTSVTTPEGRVAEIAYVPGTKRPSSITIEDEDINGDPVDRTTSFTYWGSSLGYRLKTVTDARNNTTTLYYDSNAYLDYIDPPLGSDIEVTCNSVGDITAVTDGNDNTTSYVYDGIHRLEQITYPDVGAGQKSKYFDWTCCGLDQVEDENGIITKFLYEDDTDRLWKVIEDYGGLGYTTEYDYDEVGNVVSVKNARGKTREYTLDDADRLVRADYPDSTYETWTLRDDGRVYQHRDGRGRVTTYRYDADDRLAGSGNYEAIDYPDDDDVMIVRDGDGLVTSFTDGTGTTSLVYYPSTWVKSITNGAGEVVTYEYDGVGDVSRIKTPDNLYFQYTYNALNQINWTKSPNYIQFDFSYDNGGRRYRTTQPTVMYREYRYNARNWYTGLRHWATPSGQWLYNPYYYYNDGALWDHTGNPLRRLEYFPGEGNYYHMTTFRYDGVYRLTEETRRDYWGTLEYSLGYGYDGVGNRTSMTRDGVNYTYTYDDNDKLTAVSGGGQSASFGYDGAGNMTSVSGTMFGSWTLSYDDESRLTSVTYPGGTDSFSYNALGQKMRAVLGGTAYRYVYNGDRVMEETNDAGTVTTRYMTESGSYYSPLINQFRTDCGCRWPLEDGAGTGGEHRRRDVRLVRVRRLRGRA